MINPLDYFHKEWNLYRKKMIEAQSAYDAALEKYKGSEGSKLWQQKEKEAKADYDSTTKALKLEYWAMFQSRCNEMRKVLNSYKVTPPTAENERLLDSLERRKTITSEDVLRVGNTINGDEASEARFADMLRERGMASEVLKNTTIRPKRITVAAALDSVDALEERARNLIRLDKCARTREERQSAYLNNSAYHPDRPIGEQYSRSMAYLDREQETVNDLVYHSGVNPAFIQLMADGVKQMQE